MKQSYKHSPHVNSITYIFEVFSFKRAGKRRQDGHHRLGHSHDHRLDCCTKLWIYRQVPKKVLEVLQAGTETPLGVHIAPDGSDVSWQSLQDSER